MASGILVVDKPAGMTSHDVVDEIRRILGTKKVGHGGTLDPDATGVLVIGVGNATRFLPFTQSLPKRYLAGAGFGITTSSQDASGEVVSERDAAALTADAVRAALPAFVGEIEQIPPMVSAVKVGGERLYRKARRGEEVERAPRTVTVYSLELTSFVPGAKPAGGFDIACSGGTYVRTLVHDLGESLGCGAHLTSLRRTESGGFTDSEATRLEAVDESALLPLARGLRGLPALEVDAADARAVSHGRPLHPERVPEVDEGSFVSIVERGELLGVYRREGQRLVPERVVAT